MTHGENVWVDNKKWQPAEPSHCIRKKLKRVNLKFAEDQTIHSLAQSKQAGWPDASTLQTSVERRGGTKGGGGAADISGNRLDNRRKH